MQLYLAATPQALPALRQYKHPIAHVAYGIDQNGHLTRSQLSPQIRGGLMALHDRESVFPEQSSNLCREILHECHSRGYQGVLADLSPGSNRQQESFLLLLDEQLQRSGRTLYAPVSFARHIQHGRLLLCTAISGGSLQEYLQEAIGRWGVGRLALDLQRLCMDFPMPCPSGEGQPLSQEAFSALFTTHGSTAFYSGELCARYFTCMQADGHHFVLFDDAHTLRRKIQLGRELGLDTGFFMYPEVAHLLPALLS